MTPTQDVPATTGNASFKFKGKTYHRSGWIDGPFGRVRRISTEPFPTYCLSCGHALSTPVNNSLETEHVGDGAGAEEMQRYDFVGEVDCGLEPSPTGEWVLYSDAQSLITTLERDNASLRAAGGQLANCAFNLTQPSQAKGLEPGAVETLKACFAAWDALSTKPTGGE